MPTYIVRSPDGKELHIQGPAGATQGEVLAQARALYKSHDQSPLRSADAFMHAASNAVTAGYGDSIAAGIGTVLPIDAGDRSIWDGTPLGEAFKNNLAAEKGKKIIDAQDHPIATGTGTVAGGVLQAVGAGKVFKALKVGQGLANAGRVGRVAAKVLASPIGGGAVTGAAAGAAQGSSQGDTLSEHLANARNGAVLGGVGGAVIGGTVAGLAPIVSRYWNAFRGSGTVQEALFQVQKALARDGYDVTSTAGKAALQGELARFTGKPVTLADMGTSVRARTGVALRTPSNAQSQGVETLAERRAGQGPRLSTDIRANVAPRTDVHALDDSLIAQREQDALPLKQAALSEQVYRGGAPFDPEHPRVTYFTPSEDGAKTYAQMHDDRFGGGGVVQSAGVKIANPAPIAEVKKAAEETAASLGHRGYDFSAYTPASAFDVELNEPDFVAGLVQRLKSKGYDGTHLPDVTFGDTAGGSEKGITATIPFDAKSQVTIGGSTPRIPDDPILQQLARLPLAQKAIAGARTNAAAERDLGNVLGQDTSHLPDFPEPGAPLDMKALDYLKRHMDKQVSAGFRGDSAAQAEAVNMKALRDAIRERMRAAVPEYGQYLDAYHDASASMDALAGGRDFTKLDPEVIAKEQAARPTSDQELYRIGAARKLDDVVRDTTDTSSPATRILNSPSDRDQLLALGVDPQNASALNTSVAQERLMDKLHSEIASSSQDARQAARDASDAGLSVATPATPTNPWNWLALAARKTAGALDLKRNAGVNEQALPRLLEQDPAQISKIIDDLAKAGQADAAAKLAQAARAKYGSAAFGATIGSPLLGGN